MQNATILQAASRLGLLGNAHRAPRIMAALCDNATTASQLSALIGAEPALYARVLKVANSAYYGLSRSIGTIERALVILGLDAVRGIAAAACLERAVPRGRESTLVDTQELMRHSIATAAAATALAAVARPTLGSDAFIGGLLHNLGAVIQVQVDAPGVTAMLERRRQDDTRDIRELERDCAAVGHEIAIAVIFEEWQLPEAIIAATRHHHDPMAAVANQRDLAALIHLGTNLALATGHTFSLEPAPVARNAAAQTWLGLDAAALDTVAGGLARQVEELTKVLLDA